MPQDANIAPGQAPDIPWADVQYPFDGEWLPDVDPALIGPRNFASIINLRYNDRSIEGVNGYTRINEDYVVDGGDKSSPTAGGTYIKIRNGHQLRSDKTQKSHILVNATDDSNPARVYNYTDAFAAKGEFEDDKNLDPTGKPSSKVPYIVDSSAGLIPSFSNAPQNSVVYCNSEDTKIFSGYEHRLASAFLCTDQTGSNIVDVTEDLNNKLDTQSIILSANLIPNGDMELDASWTVIDAGNTMTQYDGDADGDGIGGAHSGQYCYKNVCAADDDGLKSATCTLDGSSDYLLTFWVYPMADTSVTYRMYDGGGAAIDVEQTAYPLELETWNKVTYKFTSVGAGAGAYFYVSATSAETWYMDDSALHILDDDSQVANELHLMTTRPVQGFKFYIDSTGKNDTASALDFEYWNGITWVDVADDDDDTLDTATSTKTLNQTEFYRFAHTDGNADGLGNNNKFADFRHFQELYLYAYRVRLSAGSAKIYHMTCDPGFQTVQNVWDGVYRQPIQFQVWNNSDSAFEDYTLHVNQSSDVNSPVGGQIDWLDENDYVNIMFEEQAAGIRVTMLGDLLNTAASVATVHYWNGYEWVDLADAHNFVDGTRNDAGTKSFTKTGLLSWSPPSDEQKQTLFNSLGYAYKLVVTDALSGDEEGGEADVLIDLIVGIPALLNTAGLHESKPFNFSTIYQNRLMLGGFSAGGEGNRMDFSVTNAPDVFNGPESSMDGTQSLYFGGVEPITCSTQLYNRFGASVYSMLLVMKDTEVYLMVGNSPTDFIIYPVSQTVGCPAPDTLATAEVGLEVGKGLTRNVAIWLSHYGPMMFDGAILAPLTGINNYFDPNEDEYIEWDYISRARGWVDQTYKEYNLLIPSSDTQSTNNIWLVYDLLKKKWFRKDTGVAEFPQCGWNIMNPDTGEQMVFGGIDTGYMIHYEKGTSWNCQYSDGSSGTGITQSLRTGDFWPSNNIWDETLIRKFKIICKKIPSTVSTTSHNLGINYYSSAAEDAANVIFQDSDIASGVYVDFWDMDADGDGDPETVWQSAAAAVLDLSMDVGLDRVVRLIQDMNEKGWAHSFEFEVITDDVNKGWQPIIWGLQYRVERKDNTASSTDE